MFLRSLLAAAATAAFCFCSHSKFPALIISKYLQYAYWRWRICLDFFFQFFSTKSKMASKILCRSLELEPLHGFVSRLV